MSTKTHLIDNGCAAMYHGGMATDMKRVAIFLPEAEYNALVEVSERRYMPMSVIGRRLIIEWLEREHPDILDKCRRKLPKEPPG